MSATPPFVLLDDASAPAGAARSRLYTGLRQEWACCDPATLDALWAEVTGACGPGGHLVLIADYEWGVRLQGVDAPGGRLRLLSFDSCRLCTADEVQAWLQSADEGRVEPGPAGVLALQPDLTDAAHRAAIERIHGWIREGQTYQINHTLRLRGEMVGSPVALYRRLRQRQPVAYGALIAGADDRWTLSCSPELFVRHEGGALITRPMKGTVSRAADLVADALQRDWLAQDPKNRAENLMIVDLLRNDLGRIAQVGSVRVPRLFEVETYATLHQMTSTVEAVPRPEVDLPDVLRALFPCGSITGAPKRHTLTLIPQVESSPRGVYTGAIGWIELPLASQGPAMGEFCLSVAIRTLELGAQANPQRGAVRPVTLGVGSGIVLDSDPALEADEVRLKARFVTACDPGFTLFETVRVEDGRALNWEAHAARMSLSAAALGFCWDADSVARQVHAAAAAAAAEGNVRVHRLRVDLSRDGRVQVRTAELPPLIGDEVELVWADRRLTPLERALARHKTSVRQTYDAALVDAQAQGAFDALFLDDGQFLTEGARSSVRVCLDGRWYVPPLSRGLLPSLTRDRWLSDPELTVSERNLTRTDVESAEALCVGNALRGTLRARLGRKAAPG